MLGNPRPRSATASYSTTGRRATTGKTIMKSKSEAKMRSPIAQCPETSRHGDTGKHTRDGRAWKNKVLTWYRLPARGGWKPSARAGHTAVFVGREMVVFGGIVNGERVNEPASFDLDTRVWHRLLPSAPRGDGSTKPPSTASADAPTPRAFHVSWAFDNNFYVHGGEGPTGTARAAAGIPDVNDIYGCVGRHPFAEEDGGAPLDPGRVMLGVAAAKSVGSTAPGFSLRNQGATAGGAAAAGTMGRKAANMPPSPSPLRATAGGAQRQLAVTVLDDLWKLNLRTLLWERLPSRLAPLGRKGHTASVVPMAGQPRVLMFGGAPAGRRGLSNALYSVDVALLSAGEGTWERHQPVGAAPTPRQGHSLTAVAGGKRLVLFGGAAENGELLGDVQILEVDGGSLSWAAVPTPVGDIPAARHRHCACEVPVEAGWAAGVTRGASILVFGGEGRAKEGRDIRPTDSHEALLYDAKESRWQTVETGHAFPAPRHGHSMSIVAGWTPPSFHPDGTLAAEELAPQVRMGREKNAANALNKPASKNKRRVIEGVMKCTGEGLNLAPAPAPAPGAAASAGAPSEAAPFQWGKPAPTCAFVFGGLNSMYVNPEIWMLPLKWGEKTVQFSLDSEPEEGGSEGITVGSTDAGLRGLGFTTAVSLKRAAATANGRFAVANAAAAAAGGRNVRGAAADSGEIDGDAWRLFRAAAGGGEGVVKQRRASLPSAFTAGTATVAPGLGALSPRQKQRDAEGERVFGEKAGGGSGGMGESAAELEAELVRLRRLAFVSEKKLSAEMSTRMHLEEMNEAMQREVQELRLSKGAAEAQLREEAKTHWNEGQKAKARCASLERLLAEAYDLINMVELQHHLQVKSLMPGLYRDPRTAAGEELHRNNCLPQHPHHQQQQQHPKCLEIGQHRRTDHHRAAKSGNNDRVADGSKLSAIRETTVEVEGVSPNGDAVGSSEGEEAFAGVRRAKALTGALLVAV